MSLLVTFPYCHFRANLLHVCPCVSMCVSVVNLCHFLCHYLYDFCIIVYQIVYQIAPFSFLFLLPYSPSLVHPPNDRRPPRRPILPRLFSLHHQHPRPLLLLAHRHLPLRRRRLARRRPPRSRAPRQQPPPRLRVTCSARPRRRRAKHPY